ncbi:hypothetical protein [Photobacterium leiognathi]|uniref:hypothetical protein n=1 Tax=Photobacterium leiognathi TaxID=553611 RepID=UPI003DA12B73
MDKIYQNLQTPEWWFTGVFFILFGLFLGWGVKKIPSIFKKFFRWSKYRNLKFVKTKRWCLASIQREIAKAQARFIIFAFSFFSFLGWLAYEPIVDVFETSTIAGIIISSPIYILQMIWMRQSSKVDSLILYRGKLRKTRNRIQ